MVGVSGILTSQWTLDRVWPQDHPGLNCRWEQFDVRQTPFDRTSTYLEELVIEKFPEKEGRAIIPYRQSYHRTYSPKTKLRCTGLFNSFSTLERLRDRKSKLLLHIVIITDFDTLRLRSCGNPMMYLWSFKLRYGNELNFTFSSRIGSSTTSVSYVKVYLTHFDWTSPEQNVSINPSQSDYVHTMVPWKLHSSSFVPYVTNSFFYVFSTLSRPLIHDLDDVIRKVFIRFLTTIFLDFENPGFPRRETVLSFRQFST